MVIATANKIFLVSGFLKSPTDFAAAITTNANSPPGPSSAALSNDITVLCLNALPKQKITIALIVINEAANIMMRSGFSKNAEVDMLRPTSKKNAPSNNPLNGSISVSMARRYSVSANIKPPVKAPSDMDNPALVASAPVPTAINKTAAIKRSELLMLATRRKNGCNANLPRTTIAAIAKTACPKTITRSVAMKLLEPALDTLSKSNMGITAKSCINKMAKDSCPAPLFNRFSSAKSWMTIAVDERERASARMSASRSA